MIYTSANRFDVGTGKMAERGGFEPPASFWPAPAFQAGSLSHSVTPPHMPQIAAKACPGWAWDRQQILREQSGPRQSRNFRTRTLLDSSRSTVSPREMAERGGFEPPVAFRLHWFSKPAHSATLAPLHKAIDQSAGKGFCQGRTRFQRRLWKNSRRRAALSSARIPETTGQR